MKMSKKGRPPVGTALTYLLLRHRNFVDLQINKFSV